MEGILTAGFPDRYKHILTSDSPEVNFGETNLFVKQENVPREHSVGDRRERDIARGIIEQVRQVWSPSSRGGAGSGVGTGRWGGPHRQRVQPHSDAFAPERASHPTR